jgi:adenosylmethionine-8-amino-7-oxononanoate aminotransferase
VGHFTRPIGDVIQFVPPLCSTGDEVDNFFESLSSCLPVSSFDCAQDDTE